jgi:DNA-binding response OmpR family regulator
MPRILLVDDDVELCEMLAEYLAIEGLAVTAVHDGPAALARAREEDWDALILDVMLPGMSGFDLLRELRPHLSAPVLMLTARGDDTDTVVGLELGADDYVAKPASPRVLVARLRALLRRAQGQGSGEPRGDEVLRVGDVSLDPARRRVTVAGRPVELTGAEFNLLAVLLRAAGRPVDRETLAEAGLGRPLQAYDRRIETHMTQVRRKLGPRPDGGPRILTVRGVGYQYVPG